MSKHKNDRPVPPGNPEPDNFQRIFENDEGPAEILSRLLLNKPIWQGEIDADFRQAAAYYVHLRTFGFVTEKDRAESMEFLEDEIRQIESEEDYTDGPQGIYRCFGEPFERTVYRFRVARRGKIIDIEPRVPYMYAMHGVLLMKRNRPLEARAAFEKALSFNPVCAHRILYLIDTFRAVGDLENFYRLTIDAFKTAFTSFQIAMLYRNLAYYFTEKKLFTEAHVLYNFSLSYDRHEILNDMLRENPLERIAEKSGRKVKKPTKNQFYICVGKHSFPLGSDDKVFSLAGRYADAAQRKRKWEDARYYYKILYDISPGSPFYASKLDELDSRLGFSPSFFGE